MIRLFTIIFFVSSITSSHAQKKYYWKDIVRTFKQDTSRLYLGPNDSLIFANIYPLEGKDTLLWENDKIVCNRRIELDNAKIKLLDGDRFHVEYFAFEKPVDLNLNGIPIQISDCIFNNTLNLKLNNSNGHFSLSNSKVNGSFIWLIKGYSSVYIYNNEFVSDKKKSIVNVFDTGISKTNTSFFLDIFDTLRVHDSEILDFAQFFATIQVSATSVSIENNHFNCSDLPQIELKVESDVSKIESNDFKTNFILRGSVSKLLAISENSFQKKIAFDELMLPEKFDIDWNSIKDHLAVELDTTMIFTEIPVRYYFFPDIFPLPKGAEVYNDSLVNLRFLYHAQTYEALKLKSGFKKLTEKYKTLYDSYKLKGDLESANGCFVAAKDLEGTRLAAVYKSQGGFKNYFSWKLNRLMKVYTNHATEPAQALVVSVYILLGFALFYFFFPSEWDVERKGKMVQHYRDFVQKNDKGYFVPFLKMLLGFLISFLNAFTLSLNSFVTLGFGNIPTKGIARYVCIIQGFIGWFLLSVFTVSLFNQVLF